MWETLCDLVFGMEDKLLRVNSWRDITNEEINDYLIHGADVNFKADDGWTVLMQAALCGAKPGTLRYLVELGANPNETNYYGLKAWNYATNEVSGNVLRRMTETSPNKIAEHDKPILNYGGHIRN